MVAWRGVQSRDSRGEGEAGEDSELTCADMSNWRRMGKHHISEASVIPYLQSLQSGSIARQSLNERTSQ